jgi:hypothetical protein
MKLLHIIKIKIFFFTFLLFITVNSWGQAPNWLWSKSAGGNNSDFTSDITVDANGNSYLVGAFRSPTISFGGITLTNADNSGINLDIFIVKYNASGNVQWAKSAGGIYTDYVTSISIDANGYLYITGHFESSTITFDGITLTNADVTNGSDDIFIVKYNSSGSVVWAKREGGTDYESGMSIAVGNNGNNLCITGYFRADSINIGGITLINHSSGFNDIYIAKYDTAGNIIWAKNAGGIYNDISSGLTVDSNGNMLLTGYFSSPTIMFGGTSLINHGNNDVFISKYDPSGNVIWAESAGALDDDRSFHISVDANSNSYITGYYKSTSISFDTITLINTTPGIGDIFITKYDSSGNAQWAETAVGADNEFGYKITVDIYGNTYLIGTFYSSTITFGSTTLTYGDPPNIFLVKYDDLGNVLWAKGEGGNNADYGIGIKYASNGNLFVAGHFFSSSLVLGSNVLTNLTGNGNSDIFIGKLDNTTGIAVEGNFFNDVTVFPNPITDILNVTINNSELSEIIIYDIASRIILQQTFKKTASLNTAELTRGIYIYEIRNKDSVIRKEKIIKE